jgi:phosphatidylinositol glycan class M
MQAFWLQQAYQLEFLGKSTFVPGLFVAGLVFFAVNCWILGIMVKDMGDESGPKQEESKAMKPRQRAKEDS